MTKRVKVAQQLNEQFKKNFRQVYDEYLDQFRHVSQDVQKFHYEEGHNLRLKWKTLWDPVFSKAGRYIVNLLLMVFMERFIYNYLLCIHCYEIEK